MRQQRLKPNTLRSTEREHVELTVGLHEAVVLRKKRKYTNMSLTNRQENHGSTNSCWVHICHLWSEGRVLESLPETMFRAKRMKRILVLD